MDMEGCRWLTVLPFAVMVICEFTDVGTAIMSKLAMSRGMSSYVFTVYSNALATLFLLPCFVLQKKAVSLTLKQLCGVFLLGLLGSSALIFVYNGIKNSSPTLSSAIGNLIPIHTFILAIIFRMENWISGGGFLVMSSLLVAISNIAQASFVKNCPSKMTIVFFYVFFMTIQCTIYSLIVERNPSSWVLRPDIEMIAIVFTAIFGGIFRVGVHMWCLDKKGPIFVSMFKPLGVAIAAVMVIIFLGDTLHLGSVIGSFIIAIGFYAMMWGQSNENSSAVEKEVHSLASSTQQTPLLHC